MNLNIEKENLELYVELKYFLFKSKLTNRRNSLNYRLI